MAAITANEMYASKKHERPEKADKKKRRDRIRDAFIGAIIVFSITGGDLFIYYHQSRKSEDPGPTVIVAPATTAASNFLWAAAVWSKSTVAHFPNGLIPC